MIERKTVNLIEIIEILPDKPIVNIKRSKENNKYTLYYDEEGKEQKTVTIDDLPIINDNPQLFDIQAELNRLKYKQIKQKIAKQSREVTDQLKLNSWKPESERIKIANNPDLNILHNAKVILNQWFSERQVDPSPLSGMPSIRLPENKSRKPDVTQIITDNNSPSIHHNEKYIEFNREKDNVIITYHNKTRSYKTDGFKYLYHLFSNPFKKIHSSVLYRRIHFQISDNQRNETKDVIIHRESGFEAIDEIAQKNYLNKISQLEESMETADENGNVALFEKYRVECDQITKHLSKQFDVRGKRRKLGSESEKHRANVQRSIKRALEKIKSDFPDIFELLTPPTIETGNYCQYTPNDKIHINIQ